MRVLYVDANVWHINPTANQLPVLIQAQFPDVKFYGPGFSNPEDLALGLRSYVDRTGPFDAVILGPATPFLNGDNSLDEGAIGYLMRFTAHHLNVNALKNFFSDTRLAFGKLEIPVKVISVLNFDYYATTQKQIDVLLHHSIGVIGPNHQFVSRLGDLPDFASREKHFVKKADRFSDAWHDFLAKYPERVITATHFVGPQEFFFEPLSGRSYQVSVPGVEYVLRKDAVNRLAKTKLRLASKNYFHFYRVASRLGFPMFSNAVSLRMYNFLFQRTLAETRCVYTAKGGFGMPIRKFFEIPASGALLICSPCNGYRELGFEHGQHYIQAEPDELLDALNSWLDHPRGQEIASAGQALTHVKHSMSARGAQIGSCLQEMVMGTFRGARWEKGEYFISGSPSDRSTS